METRAAVTTYAWTDFLVCPDDAFALQPQEEQLTCPVCHRCYAIRDGIAMLLPSYADGEKRRYFDNYQRIAREDLEQPFEGRRDARYEQFLRFVGDTRGKRVLDVGSGSAGYLAEMDADLRVALDIAVPYLAAIPSESGLMRVCADAEQLPVAPGFFDVIILSGVLEHVLSPERLVARVHQACRPDTRVIVLVPWEEDLSPYKDMPWEFTHLRSFNSFSFSTLWHQFSIARRQATWPRMSEPILFRLDERLPTRVFDLLRFGYFHRGLSTAEADARGRWSRQLPQREWRLLGAYRPTFYQFELKTFSGSSTPGWYDQIARFVSFCSRMMRRRQ